MIISVRDVLENADAPIVVTESGISIEVNFSQPLNALFPIVVTEFGILMSFKPLQPMNELSPMVVTELGITVFEHPLISVLVKVSMMALQLPRESYTLLSSDTERSLKFSQSIIPSCLIIFTELPITIFLRSSHLYIPQSSISVTESDTIMISMPTHFSKPYLLICVHLLDVLTAYLSGMTSIFASFLFNALPSDASMTRSPSYISIPFFAMISVFIY